LHEKDLRISPALINSDQLLAVLNEKGREGYRVVSIHLNREVGQALVIFELELIDGVPA
jgi:hypothetical protein